MPEPALLETEHQKARKSLSCSRGVLEVSTAGIIGCPKRFRQMVMGQMDLREMFLGDRLDMAQSVGLKQRVQVIVSRLQVCVNMT